MAKHSKPVSTRTEADLRDEFWAAHPEALLTRKVTAAGISRSIGWLEMKALSGGGPPFFKNGRQVLYRKADTLIWHAGSGRRVTSTAQYGILVPA